MHADSRKAIFLPYVPLFTHLVFSIMLLVSPSRCKKTSFEVLSTLKEDRKGEGQKFRQVSAEICLFRN